MTAAAETAVSGGNEAAVTKAAAAAEVKKIPPESEQPRGKIQSDGEKTTRKSSVFKDKKVQSFSSGTNKKTTEKPKAKTTEKPDDDSDDWRFEIKRKKRTASRKNSGSTAKDNWYYWVVRVNGKGDITYYGTLDILDATNPERLHKYWRRSKERKNAKTNRR